MKRTVVVGVIAVGLLVGAGLVFLTSSRLEAAPAPSEVETPAPKPTMSDVIRSDQSLIETVSFKRAVEGLIQKIINKARPHDLEAANTAQNILQDLRAKFGAVIVAQKSAKTVRIIDMEAVCAEGGPGCSAFIRSEHFPDGVRGYVSWHDSAIYVNPDAKVDDGYLPYAVIRAFMVGGKNPPETTTMVIRRLIDGATEGAYKQELRDLAAKVENKEEPSLVHGGATFIRFQPQLDALLGIAPDAVDARKQFMSQLTADLNVYLYPNMNEGEVISMTVKASNSRRVQDFINGVLSSGTQ